MILAVALCLIYTAESAARTVREARIARLKANSEIAYWAAEAGFNRVRARIAGGNGYTGVLSLDGVSETFSSGATYALEVTGVDPSNFIVRVKSTGTYGTGQYAVTQVVAGTVQRTSTSGLPRRTHTVYD